MSKSSETDNDNDKVIQIHSLQHNNSELKTRIQVLEDENGHLRNQIDSKTSLFEKTNRRVSELESERDSLLTAIRLLQVDSTSNCLKPTFVSVDAKHTDVQIIEPTSKTSSSVKKKSMKPKKSRSNIEDTQKDSQLKSKSSKSSTSTIVLGDSIVKHLTSWKMSESTKSAVKINSFPGACVEDMYHFMVPSLKNISKPANVILHVGTNDLRSNESSVVADSIIDLARHIEDTYPQVNVSISELTVRCDNDDLDKSTHEVNKKIKKYCKQSGRTLIKHKDIDLTCLNKSKLHLNKKGVAILANDLTKTIGNFH
jgi:hypothetical protein